MKTRRREMGRVKYSPDAAEMEVSRKERLEERRRSRRRAFYSLLIAAGLVLGVLVLGERVLSTGAGTVASAVTPVVLPAPEPLVNDALIEARARSAGETARRAAEEKLAKQTTEEKAAAHRETAKRAAGEDRTSAGQASAGQTIEEQPSSRQPPVAQSESSPSGTASPSGAPAPPSTAMTLTVPAMGKSGEPIGEGVDEGTLYNGPGHAPGTGYPWIA
ncbi:MAG TPA: hypothetical protein VFJ72_07885, partial [Rubrobacteraceae bacterium]|nr:hypothetical protein [Rubrobacteraceae bacterium]